VTGHRFAQPSGKPPSLNPAIDAVSLQWKSLVRGGGERSRALPADKAEAAMWFMLAILALLTLAALILPWVTLFRISNAERRLLEAEARIDSLLVEISVLKGGASGRIDSAPEVAVDDPKLAASLPAAESAEATAEPPALPDAEPERDAASLIPKFPRPSFEQQFGVRLPVWFGGAALILAGFFLVKFSIEQGWLNPTVRVILGVAFGLSMLASGGWVRRNDLANAAQIGQSLTGAGIAVLYGSLYAATTLYELVPAFLGFGAMAALTMAALVLSLRHGPPIALLGLLGGFLTPALVKSGNPSAPVLFIYLYFVLAGLLVLIRREHWWLLSLPSVAGTFGWVLLWLFGGYFTPGDTIWLGLFLLAVSATVVAASRREFEEERAEGAGLFHLFKAASVLNILTMGGAALIMGAIGWENGFAGPEWILFGLLSAGGLGLACFDQRLYGAVPWLTMAVNAVMLAGWDNPPPQRFAMIAASFGALFALSGYALQFRSPRPMLWAALFSAASLGYFLIAYFRLHETPLLEEATAFWGILALALAGLSTFAAARVLKKSPGEQALLAVFSGTATAFIALGLAMELRRDFLSVAISAEMLALAWIGVWLEIKALRYLAALLACVFAFLVSPQILLIVELTAYSLFETELDLQETIPLIASPVFQLGLPAAFFGGTAYLLRFRKDDGLIRILEVSAIALFGLMGYYLMRRAFHVDENVLFAKASFIERGVVTNAIFVYGLACLWFGRRFARAAISASGVALAGVALFRIVFFDLLAYNPVWTAGQNVGALPIANALLLTFGLPILLTWRLAQEAAQLAYARLTRGAGAAMLVLAFALATFEVRQLFHGADLSAPETPKLEVYAYSLAWLLFSLALLFIGTLRRGAAIRIASLAVMILTAGKVFLYDASQLTGLTRVVSFLGLGLSLLGISWFYSRFVFRPQADAEGAPEK
jgi:uncharacterized membrane protein